MVARYVRDVEAGSSSLPTPTSTHPPCRIPLGPHGVLRRILCSSTLIDSRPVLRARALLNSSSRSAPDVERRCLVPAVSSQQSAVSSQQSADSGGCSGSANIEGDDAVGAVKEHGGAFGTRAQSAQTGSWTDYMRGDADAVTAMSRWCRPAATVDGPTGLVNFDSDSSASLIPALGRRTPTDCSDIPRCCGRLDKMAASIGSSDMAPNPPDRHSPVRSSMRSENVFAREDPETKIV